MRISVRVRVSGLGVGWLRLGLGVGLPVEREPADTQQGDQAQSRHPEHSARVGWCGVG